MSDDLQTTLTILLALALIIVAPLSALYLRWAESGASSMMTHEFNAPVVAAKPIAEIPGLIGAHEWWQVLVTEVLHLLIVGTSGAGKTTFARAFVAACSEFATIVILDPHASPDDWGVDTAHIIGAGYEYDEINTAMEVLTGEMKSRYQKRARGETAFTPIFIFGDEWAAVSGSCKNAPEFMKRVAYEGRKVEMHLCILTQSPGVEALNIKGEGDVRKNFTQILLGSFARKALPQAFEDIKYPAVLDYQDNLLPLDTRYIPNLATNPVRPGSVWRVIEQIENEVPAVPVPAVPASFAIFERGTPLTPEQEPELSDLELKAIKDLLITGWYKSDIAKLLGGRRQTRLEQIRQIEEKIKLEGSID